jgi:Putative DNA-binding domain
MDTGTFDAAQLAALLRESRRRVWVRALLGSADGVGSPFIYAQALVGRAPEGWEVDERRYAPCSFVSALVSSSALAAALKPSGVRKLRLGGLTATLQVREGGFQWTRHPGLARFDRLALRWPSVQYEVPLEGAVSQLPNGFLVGRHGTGSFHTVSSAFNRFFFNDPVDPGNINFSLGKVDVFVIDDRAYFKSVRVGPASVAVVVGGRGLRGCDLELSGSTDRAAMALDGPGRVAFPLATGLASDAWLWLKSEGEWLDYRSLGGWGAYFPPDVKFEEARDPVADLTSLASQGEGPYLEYKVSLPDTSESKRTTFKTVVAFANGGGGRMLFGVSDGQGIVGLEGRLSAARDRLNDLVRDLVDPHPPHRIEQHTHEGKGVLVLVVEPNQGVVYALTVNKNKPEYFVRREGSTFYARPGEIAAILASRVGTIPSMFGA